MAGGRDGEVRRTAWEIDGEKRQGDGGGGVIGPDGRRVTATSGRSLGEARHGR